MNTQTETTNKAQHSALQEMADIAQNAGMHPDRINAVCDRFTHADKLAEALRDIRDCAYDPDQVAEISYDPNAKPIGEWIGQGNFALGKFASRIYSVAKAALAAWEDAQ